MYHRVASGMVDPWRLCVTPEHFEEHLEVLAQGHRPATLPDLVEARGRAPAQGMVAITFDDGYADNLHAAAPLLTRHAVPATFFLTSGMIGATREFWWDELERLLLGPTALPPRLEIPLTEERRTVVTGPAAGPLSDPQRSAAAVLPWEAAADTRVGFFYRVWRSLQTLEEAAQQQALLEIRQQLGVPDVPRESHRALTHDEARRLADTPGLDVGAHSVTHPALSARAPAVQLREIRQSKQTLEALIGRPIRGFAYPYGDHGPETPPLVREAGFEFACSTEAGCVTRDSAALRLPRVTVEDWDGAQFAQRVAELFR